MAIETQHARMRCNTSGEYFGPTFESNAECEAFIRWNNDNRRDARKYSADAVRGLVEHFRTHPDYADRVSDEACNGYSEHNGRDDS